jgi:hypothetical protein
MARLFVLATCLFLARPTYATDCSDGPVPARSLLFEDVIFAGTVKEHVNSFALFRVTEAFRGAREGAFVNVLGLEHAFSDGEQFLVFANRCPDGSKGCLMSEGCSSSYLLKYAQAALEQLRAEKIGHRVASLYGMLWRRAELSEDDYEQPLAHIVVRVRSGSKSFETKTDEHGAYAFPNLPNGTYQVSADLPPNLEIGATLGDYPIRPFELTPEESYERNLSALPKGRITGTVRQADGTPLDHGYVHLYVLDPRRADQQNGLDAWQGAPRESQPWHPFEFNHLPPGDYVVSFSGHYGLPDTENARVIHLSDGQQVTGADIYLKGAPPAR